MKRKLSKIKFSDDKIASVQAIMYFGTLLLLYSCTQWECAEYPLTIKYQLNKVYTFTM